ncbi:hypothetical protein CMV_016724 [Castanea mollissima]|uniref:Endonuclease/exonuclease/phosphatase domain-containing protein n=1 Tax=Castanea mollissima TaxID=60419 RepID=A0A8J4QTL3_9ROSI|nr:hypothetical protein CMV_016724 [Castanea mollissima]
MSCWELCSSSWVLSRAPMAMTSGSSWRMGLTKTKTKTHHPSFFFKLKPSCCTTNNINGPTESSASSSLSSRAWYNPLTRTHRSLDQDPDIVRHWIQPDQPLASPERFTVASYNILGDRNASKHRDLYTNVPSLYMTWERRKKVIYKELMRWNPDIICLQEVDKYYDLSEILVKAGYVGSYKRRTGGAIDGCAMFWKANEFRLLEGESIEFKGFGLRDNVAQLSVFEVDV